jgi:hypothetical protein
LHRYSQTIRVKAFLTQLGGLRRPRNTRHPRAGGDPSPTSVSWLKWQAWTGPDFRRTDEHRNFLSVQITNC